MGYMACSGRMTGRGRWERDGRTVHRRGAGEGGKGLVPIVWYVPDCGGFYGEGTGRKTGVRSADTIRFILYSQQMER